LFMRRSEAPKVLIWGFDGLVSGLTPLARL